MVERRIAAMHKRYGVLTGLSCRDCSHLRRYEHHGRHYYKCDLYGTSRSESTDWRQAWAACGMYNMPAGNVEPLISQIVHGARTPEGTEFGWEA